MTAVYQKTEAKHFCQCAICAYFLWFYAHFINEKKKKKWEKKYRTTLTPIPIPEKKIFKKKYDMNRHLHNKTNDNNTNHINRVTRNSWMNTCWGHIITTKYAQRIHMYICMYVCMYVCTINARVSCVNNDGL